MRRGVLGLASLTALSFALLGPARGFAACDQTGVDAADIADARADVAANCQCATAENHGAYVRCSAGILNTRVGNDQLNPACKGKVQRCAARSTCGKPGFVTCCRRTASGKVICSTKSSAAKCTPPNGGEACVGTQTSCCDACNAANHPPCAASPSGAFLDGATLLQ